MLIIIKVGGCLITDKSSSEPKVNYNNLNRIAIELSRAYKELGCSMIVIHGAGSYGHPIVKRTGIDEGIKNERQLIDFAETQRLQNEFNSVVCKSLINEGLPAFPFQASASSVMSDKRLVKINAEVIKGIIKLRMIPVLYGVPAFDKKQGCSILSGDQLMTYLGREFKADKLIFATDVLGVYTSDPKKDKNAKLINYINKDSLKQINLSDGVNTDVTGGMLGKVYELIGFKAQIINGLVKDNVYKALKGAMIGTMIDLK